MIELREHPSDRRPVKEGDLIVLATKRRRDGKVAVLGTFRDRPSTRFACAYAIDGTRDGCGSCHTTESAAMAFDFFEGYAKG